MNGGDRREVTRQDADTWEHSEHDMTVSEVSERTRPSRDFITPFHNSCCGRMLSRNKTIAPSESSGGQCIVARSFDCSPHAVDCWWLALAIGDELRDH